MNTLTALFKKNFVSPAPHCSETEALHRLIHCYQETKTNLELHYKQYEIIQHCGSEEIIYVPEELTDLQDQSNHILEQIKLLKDMKQALQKDILACKRKMRDGDGNFKEPEKFEAKI